MDDLLEIIETILQDYFKNSLNNYLQLKHSFIIIKVFNKKTLMIENQIKVLHRVKPEQELLSSKT